MLPYYLDRYPNLSNAVLPVSGVIEALPSSSEAKQMPKGHFELEVRLGTRQPSGDFKNGVSKEFMQQVTRLFQQFEDWHEVTPWTEMVDYFYDLPPNPVPVRSSVTVGSHNEWQSSHIRKHTQESLDVLVNGQSRSLYDFRVRLNFEESIPVDMLPQHIQPSLVRIKQRRRFSYGRKRMNSPLWAYDLTCSWSGKSLAEAEQNKKNEATTYEIELECLDPENYMSSNSQDQLFLATSMLIKTTQLFETDEFQLTPQPRPHFRQH
jgi:hypothetical protein